MCSRIELFLPGKREPAGNSGEANRAFDRDVRGNNRRRISYLFVLLSYLVGTGCSGYWLYCYTSTMGCDEDEVALLAALAPGEEQLEQ